MYWVATLALLAALGAVCWLVVVPVLEAKSAAAELSRSIAHEMLSSPKRTVPIIARLGGPEEASRKLGLLLRLPVWVCAAGEQRAAAVTLLAYCEKPALPELIALLDSGNEGRRALGAHGVMIYSINHYPALTPASSLLPVPFIDKPIPSVDLVGSMETAARQGDPKEQEAATKALRFWRASSARVTPKPY